MRETEGVLGELRLLDRISLRRTGRVEMGAGGCTAISRSQERI